ncbi:hypothetical protein EDC94DRAFT_78598 [Helicostylum pulchrum]|nr:hypothetical protein EDC94DRAFT_78598 [Helicostylum pulchrum]
MPSQSILPPLTTEAKRAVTNDLNEVYNCASQISNQLLVGPSIINASAKNKTVHLPSISELDCMIDSTGRMMRVLDDAKHKWFIPSSPPLPVTQYRTVVSNIPQDGRTTITKRPFKRQRTVSLNSNKSKNKCHSCKSTETPEWRKGPLGPRTLCNACGLIWTKLCKQQLDDDISRKKFKNNSSNSSPIISDDGKKKTRPKSRLFFFF